jgi:hypothetical protein
MKVDILRIVYIFGVVGVIIGALDPLEGSVIIAIGSVLLAVATWFKHDDHRKIFLFTAIGIVFGVSLMFVFSDMGGFSKDAPLSWGWSLLIAPYPLGWLVNILYLMYRLIKKRRLGQPLRAGN